MTSARAASGVLWLHLGYDEGTFASRTRIGGGWNAYSHLVGFGDGNRDGRPDLFAYDKTHNLTYFCPAPATGRPPSPPANPPPPRVAAPPPTRCSTTRTRRCAAAGRRPGPGVSVDTRPGRRWG
ncbi:hypothetical protein GCM10018787_50750 [Streptomyces thermodiastaticus]|nr:hypothetical protein GCM10018787_50750 [Streptomyces thermodiastaticus]